METSYKFRYGPIETEITVTEDEDHREAIETVLDTLEEIEDDQVLTDVGPIRASSVETDSVAVDEQADDGEDSNPETGAVSEDTEQASLIEGQSIDSEIESVARQCQVAPADLVDHVDIDPEREHPPFLTVSPDRLGERQTEKQMQASLALLYVFDVCYDQDSVPSSDLKDALEYSNISSNNMFNMYNYDDADRYFDQTGRGASATVGLTRPGLREAKNVIQELVEQDLSENETADDED
jgi:hypothetical protein